MDDHSDNMHLPRVPLFGAIALVLFARALVTYTRLQRNSNPPETDTGASVVIERDLRFQDRPDGSITVTDTRTAQLVDTVAPGTNGFLRGTLRGLARERKREGIGQQTPFALSATRSGHLLLADPATGRQIDLGSFGPTNAGAFARLLDSAPVVATRAVANHS